MISSYSVGQAIVQTAKTAAWRPLYPVTIIGAGWSRHG